MNFYKEIEDKCVGLFGTVPAGNWSWWGKVHDFTSPYSIEDSGHWAAGERSVFKDIPNTEEGLAFIKMLKEHKNPRLGVRVRGRGPRRAVARADGKHARAYDQDLPQDKAERFSIYLDTYPDKMSYSHDYHRGKWNGISIGILGTLEMLEDLGINALDSLSINEVRTKLMESVELVDKLAEVNGGH